ncbi:DUF4398 domain-containing protein [Marinospirillum alkaliphilum]|uniref:DUF4398 domain-containing protein n=1 Tax=Marinospirillum alkaliphilum DSM 21637 TaxID=1122209 RepID=A0A1K1XDR0_9GAMM|nr:DUF4398 domain-containing protein [Marinospirillum alkaliphilum]SFX47833.1 protein of unknown function [Marinospirillum alkaliphilum DSM 21637]
MKCLSEERTKRMTLLPLSLLLSLLLLSACASTPDAPNASMSDARDAIAQAEQADSRQYAGGELNEARRKLEMAERAIHQEDMVEAGYLAREAEVLALLAAAKTEAAKAAEINQEMERAAKALTEEMGRSGDKK